MSDGSSFRVQDHEQNIWLDAVTDVVQSRRVKVYHDGGKEHMDGLKDWNGNDFVYGVVPVVVERPKD